MLHVVELYLIGELSYRELAPQVGLSDSRRIVQWVRAYRAAGPDALRTKKKGRRKLWTKIILFTKSRKVTPTSKRNF